MNELMLEYLCWMESEGRATTAECYELGLRNFDSWLREHSIEPTAAVLSDLQGFQRWLSADYRSPNGKRLSAHTLATRVTSVKMFYRWMLQRRLILADPSKDLTTPVVRRKRVACDALSQQEVAAMLETQARRVADRPDGTFFWAIELRNLSMLALAIASGRRRTALLNLKATDMDFDRNEIRVEWEKGKPGRVLPCAAWAMKAVADYIQRGRSIVLNGRMDKGWLFPGTRLPRCNKTHLHGLVARVQAQAAADNPDLEDLARKKLGTHGLRVTYATMLFLNGANIRAVNELLMHRKLTTTSRYTLLSAADLRSGIRSAHPRA